MEKIIQGNMSERGSELLIAKWSWETALKRYQVRDKRNDEMEAHKDLEKWSSRQGNSKCKDSKLKTSLT